MSDGLIIQTHQADGDGECCDHCGLSLPPPLPLGPGPLRPIISGELIAVIETVCVPFTSYRPGLNDSNAKCGRWDA